MEPQTAARLRAAGWKLPEAIPVEYVLRVYDTRLETAWLLRTLPELGLLAGPVRIIGGDFLTKPHMEDAVALQQTRMQRWGPAAGPEGDSPCHLVVPPRPHVARWLERARLQLQVEAVGTWMTVAIIVPRRSCPTSWTSSTVVQAVPQLDALVADPTLEVKVRALGERPPIVRVPANVMELPARWEAAQLAQDRVLVFVSFKRHAGPRVAVQAEWLRGPPPAMPAPELELLRLELVLPAATKSDAGERALRATIRKVAAAAQLGETTMLQLRQVQAAHGAVYALMGVPSASARSWLRASGCEGLFIRPFWTEATGEDVRRDKFSLLWVKGGTLEVAPQLWQAVQDTPGFFGLLLDGKDLAIRVSEVADRALLQAKVSFVLPSTVTLRCAEPGVRWWKLWPLREAELGRVRDLIAGLGLELARAELRVAHLTPFRYAVFFPGRGQPSKLTLDDGGWVCSEAKLTPAEPPARRKGGGAALAPQSTWGGMRSSQATGGHPVVPAVSVPAAVFPTPASPWTPTVWSSAAAAHPASSSGLNTGAASEFGGGVHGTAVSSLEAFPSLVPASGGGGNGATGRGGRGGGRGPRGGGAAPADASLAAMATQLQSMAAQIASLQEELRGLRKENEVLRREVDLARGVHRPYDLPSLPPPPPAFSPSKPSSDLTRTAAQLSPSRPGGPDGVGGDQVMGSPSQMADPKRVRRDILMSPALSTAADGVASTSTSSAPAGAVSPYDV